MSSPSSRIVPSLGLSRAPSRFRNVVLPTPEAPMTATSSPRSKLELEVLEDAELALGQGVNLADVPGAGEATHISGPRPGPPWRPGARETGSRAG